MHPIKRLSIAGALAISAAALGGCVDDYGYGGVAVGYPPGSDGYYNGYYGAYGDPEYGYGYPGYYGWYGGFYYPGTGYYVYDRYRRPYRWNGDQRRYWGGQRHACGAATTQGFRSGTNWQGFNRGAGAGRPAGQAFRGGGGGFHGGGHRR